jgi:hypothetical protein
MDTLGVVLRLLSKFDFFVGLVFFPFLQVHTQPGERAMVSEKEGKIGRAHV